jgi:hypothetical protein
MKTDLIKRYTYAVTQKLPVSQRADIEKELNGLIEDQLEDRVQGREATEKDVEQVLVELGSPSALADKYRGHKLYLISPEAYPFYSMIMKIVIGSVALAMLVVFVIQTLSTPQLAFDHFIGFLTSTFSACIQAFAWVTIIYSLIDRARILEGEPLDAEKEWKISDLPQLPEDQVTINRADPIAGIVFTVIYAVLIVSAIHLFGMWVLDGNHTTAVIPFFNIAVFQGFVPYILGLAALSILCEAVQLITGKWTVALVAFDALTNALNFVLALFMFSGSAIWNPNFMQQVVQAGLAPVGSSAYQTLSFIWGRVTQGMIYFIAIIFAIQMISTLAKVLRMKGVTLSSLIPHSTNS